jgi:hypothetical protein
MSAKTLQELQRQQEAQAIQLERLKRSGQYQQARREEPQEDFYIPPEPPQQKVYNEVTPEQIAIHAANMAADHVTKRMQNLGEVEQNVKGRMNRLMDEYPALKDEGSVLVAKAREEYQRIAAENPSLDEATRYELSVKSAASSLGARPVNAPIDPNEDYVMPTINHARSSGSTRGGKSRLTQAILQNARIMGINIDPKTADGKKNLAELEESTARFNADADESQYKYR